MNITGSESGRSPIAALQNIKLRPGLVFGIIILTALLAFEIFNYSTTDFALRDLLGDLSFAGLRWATVLTIAFCGIDFAGIARLFTPEQGNDEPKEVWYLFGAWFLAATMNAILTWWGVSMAITNHAVISSQSVVDANTLTKIVPVFVAIMVWVIRILIIGSLSYTGDRIFGTDSKRRSNAIAPRRSLSNSTALQSEITPSIAAPRPAINRAMGAHPAAAPRSIGSSPEPQNMGRAEPTYHSIGARPAARAPMGDNSSDYHRP